MTIRTYNFTFDVKRSIMPEPVFIRQNDSTGATLINVHLVDNGVPVTINGDLEFRAMTADSQNVIADTTGFSNIDIDKGAFSYALPNQLSMTPGKIRIAYFMMVDASGNASTLSFVIFVKPSADLTPSGAKNYISIVDGLIKAFNEWNETAQSSWQDFVNGNKEIIESIDPGGKVLSELIDFRHSDMLSKTFDTAKLRGDFFDQEFADRGVNIKWYGAKGDGITDDTQAINNALDYASQNNYGTVFIPNGTYMINGTDPSASGNYLSTSGGIELKSGINIFMEEQAMLQIIPNSQTKYALFRGYGVENITISGGNLIGDRNTHIGTTGEWGYGISLLGSNNITIDNVDVSNFWGDGLNLQVLSVAGSDPCKNITIKNVNSHNNRRQAMSIESGLNIFIENSSFSSTNGTAPQCGVDIEPWDDKNIVDGVTFNNCVFKDNIDAGLLVTGGSISNVNVNHCDFSNNLSTGRPNGQLTTYLTTEKGNITISNNIFRNSKLDGIRISGGRDYNIYGNLVQQGIYSRLGLDGIGSFRVNIHDNTIVPFNNSGLWHSIDILTATEIILDNNIVDYSNYYTVSSLVQISTSNRITIANNKFINGSTILGISQSNDVDVRNNTIHNGGLRAFQISGSNISVIGNTVYGSGHVSGGTQDVLIESKTGVLIIKNNSFLAAILKNTASFGANATKTFLRLESGITDYVVENNYYPTTYTNPYSIVDQPTTGYFVENGVMNALDTIKPTHPKIGLMFLSKTDNSLNIYKSTGWVKIL